MKNILLILCDQLRKDTLGCYGNPICRTPHIDALAARGTAFENCYVANPICAPNRMSLFTGMYPRNHGTWTNGLDVQDRGWTLCTHLSERGCQTANIGKIHFTITDPTDENVCTFESGNYWKQPGCYDFHGPYWGFEYVDLTRGHTCQEGHYRQWFYENGGTDDMFECNPAYGDRFSGTMKMPERLHCSTYVGEKTCEYLTSRRDREKPFFLVASFSDPHHPWDPPEETAKRYPLENIVEPVCADGSDLAGRPRHYQEHFEGNWHRSGPKKGVKPAPDAETAELWKRQRIAYTYAMVDLIDRNVGKILKTLEEEGLNENTLVVFTSDHGELLGDHGLWKKGPFFYDGLMNVPLIVAGCGVQAGVRSDALVSTVDIAPMMCALSGAEMLPFADGVSPFDRDGHLTPSRRACLIEYRIGYGARDSASFALIDEQWKYVRHQTGEEELCDRVNDPREHVNLTDEKHREVRADMALKMLDMIIATGCKAPRQISHG